MTWYVEPTKAILRDGEVRLSRCPHKAEATGSNPVPATKPIEWQHQFNEKSEPRKDC